jgi:hypothetical protein
MASDFDPWYLIQSLLLNLILSRGMEVRHNFSDKSARAWMDSFGVDGHGSAASVSAGTKARLQH